MTYQSPKITVDGVVFTELKVLLVKRKNPPFQGMWALPGGFVEYGETTEQAVVREVKEETGLITTIGMLLGVYSDPNRDPRGHTISIVYILKRKNGMVSGGDDAAEAAFHPLDKLPKLSFDHDNIIKDALRRKKDVLSKM
ncbi:MAG: NUDIX hydrolase [Candidatus Thermoplasmatota archaeon]|nr:NUDIX hydrolase [Candidatus Thermoplasmatota archaeon]